MKNGEIIGVYSNIGRQQGCIQGFVGRADGRRPFGRPRIRMDDNIQIDLQYVG